MAVSVAAIVGCWLAPARQLRAQADSWSNGGGGKWETPGNWSAGAPSSSQQMFITNVNTKAISIDAVTSGSFASTLTVNSLTLFGGGANTLLLTNSGTVTPLHVLNVLTMGNGGVLIISNAAMQVDGNSFADGTATMLTGQVTAADVIVGSVTGAQGTLTVAGGTLQLSSFLSSGDAVGGTGAVWVTGGQVIVTNAYAWAGYSGVGQMSFSNATVLGQLMFLGQFPGSQGTLTMVNATYRLASFLSIGESADATGAVWMTGGQLTVTNAPIEVGFSGSGQLTVSNGVVSAAQLYVGTSVGSAGTVTMLNSATINLSSNMVIGSTSSNYIFGGGVTGSVFAAGTVWLKGGSLMLTNSQMDIGLDGIGTVIVSNGVILARDVRVNATDLGSMSASSAQGNLTVPGGKVTVFNSLVLGDCASGGGVGNVFVTGGSVIVTNSGGTGTIDVRDGTLALSNGLVQVDRLVMTNSCGLIANKGGTIIVGTLVLDPNLSATGDGLPNGWKQQYGLNPLSSSGNNGPNGDPDGDGMSNLQEYLAGTDPTNSASALRIISVVREGADVLVTWQTVGGKSYVLQFIPINTIGYTNVFTDYSPLITMPAGPASTTNYLDVGATTNAPARYYRVRLGP